MSESGLPANVGSNEWLGVAPRWWHCDTHGPGNHTAWGCPECVREMRGEIVQLKTKGRRLYDAIGVHLDLLGPDPLPADLKDAAQEWIDAYGPNVR